MPVVFRDISWQRGAALPNSCVSSQVLKSIFHWTWALPFFCYRHEYFFFCCVLSPVWLFFLSCPVTASQVFLAFSSCFAAAFAVFFSVSASHFLPSFPKISDGLNYFTLARLCWAQQTAWPDLDSGLKYLKRPSKFTNMHMMFSSVVILRDGTQENVDPDNKVW